MSNVHTTEQNWEKVEALILAVTHYQELTLGFELKPGLKYQLDGLVELAKEAQSSVTALKQE